MYHILREDKCCDNKRCGLVKTRLWRRPPTPRTCLTRRDALQRLHVACVPCSPVLLQLNSDSEKLIPATASYAVCASCGAGPFTLDGRARDITDKYLSPTE